MFVALLSRRIYFWPRFGQDWSLATRHPFFRVKVHWVPSSDRRSVLLGIFCSPHSCGPSVWRVRERKMNRFEKAGMLSGPIASTTTPRRTTDGNCLFSPSTRHNRIKSIPHIVSTKTLCGSFFARHLVRLAKIYFSTPSACGLGDFPRSRHRTEQGSKQGLN
ncbi:hypothetical protein SAMN04488040_0280 [Sulfitobacter marinus]|uniref:Uncharacterized protein n=1 Tax=Sulfitobacter marinus TaxID=394264 RepID=A0A1I6PQ31_9RHOB|nr:hypothetical protein SAMN04488040_0280 [Sulfitobacter marinus]